MKNFLNSFALKITNIKFPYDGALWHFWPPLHTVHSQNRTRIGMFEGTGHKSHKDGMHIFWGQKAEGSGRLDE